MSSIATRTMPMVDREANYLDKGLFFGFLYATPRQVVAGFAHLRLGHYDAAIDELGKAADRVTGQWGKRRFKR